MSCFATMITSKVCRYGVECPFFARARNVDDGLKTRLHSGLAGGTPSTSNVGEGGSYKLQRTPALPELTARTKTSTSTSIGCTCCWVGIRSIDAPIASGAVLYAIAMNAGERRRIRRITRIRTRGKGSPHLTYKQGRHVFKFPRMLCSLQVRRGARFPRDSILS